MLKSITSKVTLGMTGALLMAGTAYADTAANVGVNAAQPAGTPTDLMAQIKVITNLMILFIGVVSVIMLIVGGFRYVLSAGDSKNTTAAKDTILYAIIGVVVALLSYAIMNFVLGQFN